MRAKLQKAISIASREGFRGLAQRGLRVAHRRLGVDELEFPLLPGDIADSRRVANLGIPAVPADDRPLRIGWVTTPPGLGSGGHTTMFRMIAALEAAGHTCVLFLYDRYNGDLAERAAVIRTGWPQIKAEIRDCAQGIRGVDAAVATSWQTAHVLAVRATQPLHRLYFIQDFEPFFVGRGAEYELAEDTYRLGFRNVALGHMVGGCLDEIGVTHDTVEFGCDTEAYHLTDGAAERRGVVFYARPGAARRGYLHGVLALQEFHRRHPEQPIHLYGGKPADLPFPAVLHGNVSIPALNQLYNSVVGGLALSYTNISLVAEEMLAAGAIPVVNDSHYARADLPNEFVQWSAPTPAGLADGLAAIVEEPDVQTRSRAAAASVRADNWIPTGEAVVTIIEDTVRGVGVPGEGQAG